MTTGFAIYDFPFGLLRIDYEGGAVIALGKADSASARGTRTALTDRAYGEIMEYLEGQRREFDFPYTMRGTAFQKRVWDALCDIPYGETRTYKEIAAAVGNPKACRAVGMANNKNPMTIVVPCHRVVGTSGKLIGYAHGLEMKEALLKLERDHRLP